MAPRARRRLPLEMLALAAGLGALHAAPYPAAIRELRARLFPRLAGLGRVDGVSLTFDDGPDRESTPAFLEALDHLGWHATFFVLAPNVRADPTLVREIVDAGHEIGLHGDRHRTHVLRHPIDVWSDISRSKAVVEEATGTPLRWFRPPHGSLSTTTLIAARRMGLSTVLWTSWGRDWEASATPESVMTELQSALVPGATLLLHDSDCTSAPGSWRAALGSLPLLADELEQRALSVRTLGQHLQAV